MCPCTKVNVHRLHQILSPPVDSQHTGSPLPPIPAPFTPSLHPFQQLYFAGRARESNYVRESTRGSGNPRNGARTHREYNALPWTRSWAFIRKTDGAPLRRIAGRHGFKDHAHQDEGFRPGYFGADVSMQPPGGPPSRNTSYHRPNQNSREKDQARERESERESEWEGVGGRGMLKRIAVQQDAAWKKPTAGLAEGEKRKKVKEVDAKRGVRYDRTRKFTHPPVIAFGMLAYDR